MLGIIQFEEIKNILLELPDIINKFEKREYNVINLVNFWLNKAETLLQKHQIPVAAEIAALRGVLLSADRGFIPNGIQVQGRPTLRKIKEIVATDIIYKAENAINKIIKDNELRFSESEKLLNQIITLGRYNKTIPSHDLIDNEIDLLALWMMFRNDPNIGPAIAHVVGLIGYHDSLLLFKRMVPLE